MGLFQRNGWNERQRGEPERSSGYCHTIGCERRVEPGVTFCASCAFDRLYRVVQTPDEQAVEHALDDWPTRPPTAFEIAAVTAPLPNLYGLSEAEARRVTQEAWEAEVALTAEQSAPLITEQQFDLRCRWCCSILAERTVAWIRPTRINYACQQHAARRAAHDETRRHIEHYLALGVSSAQIADFFRNGYLGDRLHDDEPM